ncbi:hypothetical protein BU15DRAFT_78906 [Melanogaster broomeanus]|nr:hypothetical protein BU15DRAFT_78906 [Melanogaster broomeanus]
MARVAPQYKHSSKQLVLFDFEGALWIRDMSRAGLLAPFEPQKETLALLKRLSGDKRNEVWLLSGLPVKGLDKIAEAIPGVGIVAEKGCFVRTRETTEAPANSPSARPARSWKNWACRQTAEVQNHIFDSLGERYGLRIIPGANSFLILPNNISRSTAVGAILHSGGPTHSPWSGMELFTERTITSMKRASCLRSGGRGAAAAEAERPR